MFSKFLVFLFIALMGFFTWCTCKAASWADQVEEEIRRKNDEEDI